MQLVDLLDRSEAFEQRTAALYRRFAARQLEDAELAALWTTLAAEEEEHVRSIRDARNQLTPGDREQSTVAGCEAALTDIEERLLHAEALDPDATPDRRFFAALNIELSELESLRQLALHASGIPGTLPSDRSHAHRLADTARQRSRDDHVRLAGALLLARERLAADAAARREGARWVW
jgi:rubrerythrin